MTKRTSDSEQSARYQGLLLSISELLIDGRRHAAKSLNAVLTTTCWSIGQHLVEYEQGGKERAAYGTELLKQLSRDTFRLDSTAASLKEIWNATVLPSLVNSADTVCEIESTECARFSALLVALGAFAFGSRFKGETTLRGRGVTRRLVGSPTRPPDILSSPHRTPPLLSSETR